MKYRPVLYLSLALIGSLSFLGAWLLQTNEALRSVVALPFVGSLFAALFQLVRDHSTFEKETIKQQRQHAFIVAATSHMSTVVFDKHVAFSEEYVEKTLKLLGNLMTHGPSKKVLEDVYPLQEVRRKYRLWISPPIGAALDEFESKLIRMGAAFHVFEQTKNWREPAPDATLTEAYDIFREIIERRERKQDIDDAKLEQKKSRSYARVIEHLQIILGIEKLTQLRDMVLDSSYRQSDTRDPKHVV